MGEKFTMDWIISLQLAINYLEEHILEDIDFGKISINSNYSISYLQKIFSGICGITMSEYIRRRRLTIAGNDILLTNEKITDIAFKYGYDSLESFSRAFTNFHGINPSLARTQQAKLKNFSPLHLEIDITGGDIIDYKIIEKEAFDVIEKVERQNIQEIEKTQSVRNYWRKLSDDGTINDLMKRTNDKEHIYGIYYDQSFNKESVEYSVAVIADESNQLGCGMRKTRIPKRTWAVFDCIGPMPKAMQQLWNKIWKQVLPTSLYVPTGEYGIEVYDDGDEKSKNYHSEVWISVRRK